MEIFLGKTRSTSHCISDIKLCSGCRVLTVTKVFIIIPIIGVVYIFFRYPETNGEEPLLVINLELSSD